MPYLPLIVLCPPKRTNGCVKLQLGIVIKPLFVKASAVPEVQNHPYLKFENTRLGFQSMVKTLNIFSAGSIPECGEKFQFDTTYIFQVRIHLYQGVQVSAHCYLF